PERGSPLARVTILEYADFQCPFCSRVVGTLDQIEKQYPKDVRILFKNNPLPFHQNAQVAAQASVAAANQGKFWQMHDTLFKNQDKLDAVNLEKLAQSVGLNMDQYKKDFDSQATKDGIKADQAEAQAFGARGTPSFF